MYVKCNIKSELFRNYLHHHFAQVDGRFQIFRGIPLGRYITTHLKFCDTKPQMEDTEQTVIFKLPKTSDLPSIQSRFAYFTAESMRQIEDHIKEIYNLDFHSYYYWSIKHGLQQKQAIQNFIITRKLVNKIGDIDTLKKYEYRQEKKMIETLTKKLLNQVTYQDRIIRDTIEKFNHTLSSNHKLI
ncbi:hypothetical protein [Sphingobacterium sp.]|uniref:hypothetical protein n=1 Tax=Sphingobacterium sp. TaxID=341027 RepID=UPI0028AEE75F|nr:hypothetical protein [Sphingobacterium sp.]